MTLHFRLRTVAVMAALALAGCSEHDPPGPGAVDQKPPGVAAVTGWDVTHIVVVFDERVSRETAEVPLHYQLGGPVGGPKGSPAPADGGDGESGVLTASLHADNRTVTLTTGALDASAWSLKVSGVADLHGNVMVRANQVNFEATNTPDTTPPEVVLQWPLPDAAAVSTGGFVRIGFSEAVTATSFARAFHLNGDGAQLISIRNDDDFLHYDCELNPLQPNADYTVSLIGIKDLAGNLMPPVQWTFRTEATSDTLAPAVISSRPTNKTVFVDPGTQLSFSFSEPMDPYSVRLRPHVKSAAVRWSNGGRKVTYETTWDPGLQYTIQIRPGDMRDFAGNVSTQLFTLVFSTGNALKTGRFSGTITGDADSPAASDPAGALVFAGPTSPYDLFTSVVAMVGPNRAYEFQHLPGATYFPFCVKDSNHDGLFQPAYGDAIGIYGITDWWASQPPLTVSISDAPPVSAIDFTLYDPTAVYGLINYDTSIEALIRVGLFDTSNFDPATSVPVVSIVAQLNGTWDYIINSLDTGPIADGAYYVAAYRDSNNNGFFDPSVDPFGVYGGATPVASHVGNGEDTPNANLDLEILAIPAHARAIRWPDARPRDHLKRFVDAIDVSAD
jgi:hypothetical protein